ncbi:beta-1,3-galactosyltransferase 5 [Anoplophora glabripennis]|uniref:beta-1,3-galactosyltransferase 5 n=1 Tax=Anoplophora glabripennis TaxID=217634 RepID=UPI0008744E88|nr:beta-1,3-galactosyltransferase 5 [Anoplophora glabripennis]
MVYLRMRQVRLKLVVKIPILALGILGIAFVTINILHLYHCSITFDINSYENVTYLLRKSNSHPLPGGDLLPEVDYKTLVNINFTFTTFNLICENTTPLLLILVHSAPKNFAKRIVIRETWGKSEENVKILFLLGTTDDIKIEKTLQQENYAHNDLLRGNFLDSYKNLTYKHLMGLKYVIYHCSQAKYILKVDDDVCVNLPTLKNFLIRDLSPYGATNLLMCNVVRNYKALRSYRTKWRVTREEYKEKFYPPFCLGWCILYSPDVVLRIYAEAQRTRFFWVDDVFVTGVLVSKLDSIIHTDISPLTLSLMEILHPDKCRPFLFGRADMSESGIRSLWKDIQDNPVPQSVSNRLITGSYRGRST